MLAGGFLLSGFVSAACAVITFVLGWGYAAVTLSYILSGMAAFIVAALVTASRDIAGSDVQDEDILALEETLRTSLGNERVLPGSSEPFGG